MERVAKEVHMLIDETEEEVRKHAGEVTSSLDDEEEHPKELCFRPQLKYLLQCRH